MTHEEYAALSRLFDAFIAIAGGFGRRWPSLQLHGDVAGSALRAWGAARRIDVVPSTLNMPSKTWTALQASVDDTTITVHLDDDIPVAAPEPAHTPEPDLDIPF